MRSVRGKLERILVTSSGCKLPQIWGSKTGERVLQGFPVEEPERIEKLEVLHGLSLLAGFKPEMICLFCTKVPILSRKLNSVSGNSRAGLQRSDPNREGLGDHSEALVEFVPDIICLFALSPLLDQIAGSHKQANCIPRKTRAG